MTKHRITKRRNQRGGAWYDPLGLFTSSETTYVEPTSSIVDEAKKKVDALNASIGSAAETTVNAVTDTGKMLVDKVSEPFSSTPDTTSSSSYLPQAQPSQASQTSFNGGKRKRRSRTMKGGKGGLGLTYYATPVSGIKVAEPTTLLYYENGTNQYSVKGGSKRRKTGKRKQKKHNRTRRHKKY
jgi:hypothetical protein